MSVAFSFAKEGAELVVDHRPVAEGFKKTPLIEAVIDVAFESEISPERTSELRELLGANYASHTEDAVRSFHIDLETDTASIQPKREIYRFIGEDASEIALLRPNGISTSQLAPYRCWEDLFSRFERDTASLSGSTDIKAARLATRFINRIDVPASHGIAQHEEYLAVHIRLPGTIENIGPFQLGFQIYSPAEEAEVVIQSSVVEPAIEGVASFILDIDVARSTNIPDDWPQCLRIISSFRDVKNYFYRTLLTKKALEEFE